MNFNINSLDIDFDRGFLFIGTNEGDLCIYSVLENVLLSKIKRVHWGSIESINVCPRRKYVATLGGDRFISILKYDDYGLLTKFFEWSIRDLGSDDYLPIHSPSQAIWLHPYKDIVATRSGSSCLVQIDFDKKCIFSNLRIVNDDLITVRYSSDGNFILAGSNKGEIGVLSHQDNPIIVKIDDINETIHWFEPISENSYIVATDARRLLKINLNLNFNDKIRVDYTVGDIFSDDDFEHITQHPITGRCVATSFDRRVYEVDLNQISIKKPVFLAPFKIRWAKFYDKSNDSKLVIQVRDGSILFVDIDESKLDFCFKKTKEAAWSSVLFNQEIICAGEKGCVWKLREDKSSCQFLFNLEIESFYIKRIFASNENCYFGCTNGDIFIWNGHYKPKLLINVGSAIRDLSCSKDGLLYIATEKEGVYKYHEENLHLIYKSNEPIWSLALSPNESMLAIGERKGGIIILDSDLGTVIDRSYSRVPKRIKWIDNKRFLATHSDRLDLFILHDNLWHHHEGYIDLESNTIEDYIFLPKNYIAMITYNKRIFLADLSNGTVLDSIYYGSEIMKSIIMSKDTEGRFLVFGRDKMIKKYLIHNEQLHLEELIEMA